MRTLRTRSRSERLYDADLIDDFRSFLRAGGVRPESQDFIARRFEALAPPAARSLSAATGANGAFVIPQFFQDVIVTNVKWYSAIASAATIVNTPHGRPWPIPSINGLQSGSDSNSTVENTALKLDVDTTFGVVNLKAYTYPSSILLVPFQLLEDATPAFEQAIARALSQRIARSMNRDCTVGSGVNQPMGLATAAPVGATAASATGVTYDDLQALIFSVDPVHRQNGSFQLNDATLQSISTLKDTSGRPLFLASGGGTSGGKIKGTLLGFPVASNPHMPLVGPGNKSVLFGDVSQYQIRFAENSTLLRYNERFMHAFQVGFAVISRADGNLLNPGESPVKALQH